MQFIIYSSSIYYLIYWFNSVFLFITKKSFLGKFSSLIQRFWKRTIMLFWSIEMFLFLIYLFLICNNPEESTYMLDNAKSFKQLLVSLSDVLKKTYSYMYILLILFYFLLIKKFSKKFFYLFIFLWVHNIFLLETYQLIYFQSYFNNFIYQWDQKKKSWSLIQDYFKSRTFFFFLYVLVFLKYWHVLFIYVYLLVMYWYSKNYDNVSFNQLSSILINFFYLYLFNFFFLYMFLKKLVKYLGSLEYSELHINQNLFYFSEVVLLSFNWNFFYFF